MKLIQRLEDHINDALLGAGKAYDRICVDHETLSKLQTYFEKNMSVMTKEKAERLLDTGITMNLGGCTIGVSTVSNPVMFALRKLGKPERMSDLVGYYMDDIKMIKRDQSVHDDIIYPVVIVPIYKLGDNDYEFGDKLDVEGLMKIIQDSLKSK